MDIPITKPYFNSSEIEAVRDVILSGWVVQGPKVREFEALFKRFQNSKFALALNSATSGLYLALKALDIKNRDEVIIPSFTHPATANVVVNVGAIPVFVDIKLPEFTIAPYEIEKKITNKTRAIIPVHIFGLSAEMDKILEIAKEYNLYVIEDAACAHGTEYKGKKVGTIGDCGVFSFHPRKPITTGEGGMFVTDIEELAYKVEILRNHGESISDELRHKSESIIYPDYYLPGFNFRMTDIQGAIGVEQIKKISFIIDEKRKIANIYNELLIELEQKGYLILPYEPKDMLHTYQSYVILLTEKVNISRDRLSNKLKDKGISTRKGTYNVPMTRFYRERFSFKKSDFPNAEIADKNSLALPSYIGIKGEEIDYVISNLKNLIIS